MAVHEGRAQCPAFFRVRRARILRQISSISFALGVVASRFMNETVRPAITVATIVERDGRFLLVEEETRSGLRLNQPAGHVEAGESIVSAAARETLEEAAWRVDPTALVGVYQWGSPDNGTTFVRFTFAAAPLAHEPGAPSRYGHRPGVVVELRGHRGAAGRASHAARAALPRRLPRRPALAARPDRRSLMLHRGGRRF